MTIPAMLEVFNMTLPPEGPGVVPITLDINGANGVQDIDLTQMVNDGVISYISGVQIDTLDFDTDGEFRLESPAIGQRVQIGAGAIAMFPLFSGNPPKFRTAAIDGFTGIVRLHFVNFPVFWGIYQGPTT